MKSFLARITRFLTAKDGPTAVEYSVMLMLIVLVCLSVITVIGQSTADKFEQSQTSIENATR